MTEATSRPTWDEFNVHLETSAPVALRLTGEPRVLLFVEPHGMRIGLRAPAAASSAAIPSPLVAVELAIVRFEGVQYLEVATRSRELYPHFFAFALSVADAIQLYGETPDQALRRSFRDWRSLFEQISLLSEEQQLGLMGELWFLDRLLPAHGIVALDAWTGPRGEAHDFRIGGIEFEVKTTASEYRAHMISSETQLIASPGHRLFLVSVQFAAAGPGGRSLCDAVGEVRDRFSALGAGARFDDVLEGGFGLTALNVRHYSRRLQLRSRPYLVPVEQSFPRITHGDVLALPHREMSRVTDIRYRVEVDGLGWEDGTSEFLSVLPGGSRA